MTTTSMARPKNAIRENRGEAERLFLDTGFLLALFNRRDQYHARASRVVPRMEKASELWTTEAILVEIGNGLSKIDRVGAVRFIRGCYSSPGNICLVPLDASLVLRATDLYESRPDKDWGLTDCISFVVMKDQGLTAALTPDHHFVQAGFRALLLESSAAQK